MMKISLRSFRWLAPLLAFSAFASAGDPGKASDDEKSSYEGKDSSGHYSGTDIFAKRNGHWIAIASRLTRVTP